MSYLQFNEQDFEEYLFDIDSATFAKKHSNEIVYPSDFEKYNLGFLDMKVAAKGKVYMYCRKGYLKENIMLNHQEDRDCIFLSFLKTDSFSINKKTDVQKKHISNTHSIYFMNKNTCAETDIILKDKNIEDIGVQISIPYYENLVNQYPNLFEASFLRYQRGESFFLSENFTRTTTTHYNILSQIENSHLMGTCSTAYVDAKILELLSNVSSI